MRNVAWTAGSSVVLAYVLGTIPFGYLLTRRRLRQDLRRLDEGARLDVQVWAVLTGDPGYGRHLDDLLGVILDVGKVLLGATIAWHLVKRSAPGFDRSLLPKVSAVGFLADQVLTSWQSVGLWAGLAAVVGHLAPPWLGFRAGQGQAPALALVVVYCPYGFAFSVLAFFLALAVLGDVPRAVLASLFGVVGFAWLAWIYDWRTSWGATNGPELTLWAAVVCGVIGARTVALINR